jgi:predicted signal transduction protein with EAL and GGDEF domain
MSQQTLHDHNAVSQAGDKPALGDELGLVRFRLALVIVATAVVSVAVSSAVAILVTGGPRGLFGSTLGIVPVPPAVVLLAALAACGWLAVRMARRVLHHAQELDDTRGQSASASMSGHTDTLVDALTGLGNHRAFQEEFDRQLDAVRRYGHLI